MNGCLFLLGILFAFYLVCAAIFSIYGTVGVLAFLILTILFSVLTDK